MTHQQKVFIGGIERSGPTLWGLPSIRSAVEFWLRRYEEDLQGLEYLQAKSPDRLRLVRYEDLCIDARATVSAAIEDLGPPANASGVLVPGYTNSRHHRLFKPAVDLQSWKHALTQAEAAYVIVATCHVEFARSYYAETATAAAAPVLPFSDYFRELRKPLHRISAHCRRRRRRGLEALVI